MEKCWKCFRPLTNCYCPDIVPIKTGIKFVFLMHPKEAKEQRTGTGRLAALSLPNSEIIVGVDFTQNERFLQLLNDESYFPLTMYPDENAWTATSTGFSDAIAGRTLLIILIDATWFFAKKMLRLSPNLRALPKLSFQGSYLSRYEFKKQPSPECLSTIETCYYLIKEFGAAGILTPQNDDKTSLPDPEPLMAVFQKMVAFQQQSKKNRLATGVPDRYKPKKFFR